MQRPEFVPFTLILQDVINPITCIMKRNELMQKLNSSALSVLSLVSNTVRGSYFGIPNIYFSLTKAKRTPHGALSYELGKGELES